MCTNFYYPSSGQGTIHGCRWEPEGRPRAVIQIVHSTAEYALRYEELASRLTARGYLVVAEDHMGHGESVGEEGTQGYFDGGWFKAVSDTYRLIKNTRLEFLDIPYILLGHGAGSCMVRTILTRYPKCDISAAILCGTTWLPRGIINSITAAAALSCRIHGERKPDTHLQKIVNREFNRKIEHKRTEFDWINRSSRCVDAYIEDPLCGFPLCAGLLRDMMTGLRYIQEPCHLQRMRKELPVLFIAGGDDPAGLYGDGVKRTVRAFQNAGMTNVTMRLYPLCRHELLHEINKEEVYSYIFDWLEKQGL